MKWGRVCKAMIGAIAFSSWVAAGDVNAQERFITLVSTTSTEQSGLFKHLLPVFERTAAMKVRVVAVGTGQALSLGRRGDADVVFVHDAEAEEKFMAEGAAVERHAVMYNDFVLLGPASDPAKVSGVVEIGAAFALIATARQPFVSRGDSSGTHAAEMRIWRDQGIDPKGNLSRSPRGWYRETGAGMGPALNTAASLNAYILSDRGTWLSFKNRGELKILFQGDPRLRNEYSVMLVNPVRHPHVKRELGQAFVRWILSSEGQSTIASYTIGGEALFLPCYAEDRGAGAGSPCPRAVSRGF
jgi:tungstate transport system substrate-binding protein